MITVEQRNTLAAHSADNVEAATRELLAERSGGHCELLATHACTGVATDWHHRKRRREGDHSIRNSLHACRTCHRWAHANPARSRTYGWIVPTWEDPVTTPVCRRGQWVLLTWAGAFTPVEGRP